MVLATTAGIAQDNNPQQYGVEGKDVPKGIAVGQQAPEIMLQDRYSKDFKLSKALEDGPVVLTFYRGNWCPYCTRFLAELTAYAGDIADKGARIVAISPENRDQLAKTADRSDENITLLSDTDGEIMRKYDVDFRVTNDYQDRLGKSKDVDLNAHNDQKVAELPVAATFIINEEGEIVYRHFDLDYKNRAPIKEILKALDKL